MGSSISGTYNGSLLINGAATITDAVTINGSLFCMGNLTNSEGYAVTVMSDVLIQGDMNFTPTDPTIFQEVVMIFGNLTVFGNISMLSNASSSGMFSASALIIFGNLTTVAMITSTLTASGNTAGADGLVIWVLGDAVLYEINLDGGDASASVPAGDGGQMMVQGDLTVFSGVSLNGGNSNYNNRNAGDGGMLQILGNFCGAISSRGGNATADCSAGDGGDISIVGTFTNIWSNLSGGDCSSTRSINLAGDSGDLTTEGNIVGDGYLYLNGGVRSGVLSEHTNTTTSPNGGFLGVKGSLYASQVDLCGGNNTALYSGTTSNSDGGMGGEIIAKDVVVERIRALGGSSGSLAGGKGGTITSRGRITVENGIDLTGGDSSAAVGSAGIIFAYNGLSADYINLLDGTGTGTPSDDCGIQANGLVNIGHLDQVDRVGSVIGNNLISGSNVKILLMVSAFTTKDTLTKHDGSSTASVSAYANSSIFIYDHTNDWIYISGTTI